MVDFVVVYVYMVDMVRGNEQGQCSNCGSVVLSSTDGKKTSDASLSCQRVFAIRYP